MELNIDQIEAILPHRYPFLLVDKITECIPGEKAKGLKCVTANEPFFQGHFPGFKVMPGVLIIEALAQVGAAAILTEEENKGKLALFGGIKNARFKRQVRPGDVLELTCELTARKGPVGFGTAEARVEGKLACKAELTFALTDRADPSCERAGFLV
jgi:3-hydroxyacyl-[acyl-carrier-protein] dehydratase